MVTTAKTNELEDRTELDSIRHGKANEVRVVPAEQDGPTKRRTLQHHVRVIERPDQRIGGSGADACFRSLPSARRWRKTLRHGAEHRPGIAPPLPQHEKQS